MVNVRYHLTIEGAGPAGVMLSNKYNNQGRIKNSRVWCLTKSLINI